jgi:hypothetical protein
MHIIRGMNERIAALETHANKWERRFVDLGFAIAQLLHNTDGEPLHDDAEIPAGEIRRVLAEVNARTEIAIRESRIAKAAPVPGTPGQLADKPERDRAWWDGARIWVEVAWPEGPRLHLAGWADGIAVIDPDDGTDHRDKMTEMHLPISLEPVTPEALGKWLAHTLEQEAARHGVEWHRQDVLAAAAVRLRDILLVQADRDHGQELAQLRLQIGTELMKATAVSTAAEGAFIPGLDEIIGNRDHPYWSPALDAVVALQAQPRATAAARPDQATIRTGMLPAETHCWTQTGTGQFVCTACPPEHDGFTAWPCPAALFLWPSLEQYNARYPVGTAVLFAPNGVGDLVESHTRTPVWIGKDLQPYVSVDSYPPQAGAAVKLADLAQLEQVT